MLIHFACRLLSVLLLAGGVASTSGCLVTSVQWREPNYLPPLRPEQIPRCGSTARAERIYAKGLNYEQRCRDACVDLFFEAARLTASTARGNCFCRARQLHESALMKLVVAGQRFKRLDPARGLTIRRQGHDHWIPLSRHGFVWEAADFHRLVPIGYYETNAMRDKHQRRGLGVPFVVDRRNAVNRPFMREQGAFSSTLVMRCDLDAPCVCDDPQLGCRLELYDPLRVDSIDVDGVSRKIAKDTTAPLVYALQGQQWTYLNYFINPSSGSELGGLYMLEPYQQNKIPLVLIHGLLSDPFTWVHLANELRVHPGFVEHYQIWAFEYSTGNSVLRSASGLREQLVRARQHCDPSRRDPQMSNMVLVGHSMGGLIAKLQITSSGDQLWGSVANRSLNELCLPEPYREELRRFFYFEPSPDVSRVVFMATPHRGSSIASGPVGRLGSRLVNLPEEMTRRHELLLRCNPGVFTDEIAERIPTSIDLLNPHSKLLEAIGSLPAADHVCMHSIMGNQCWTLLQGKSDGIVPLSSAKEPRAVSEKIVKATHSGIKSHPEAVKEILYILQEQLQRSYDHAVEPSDDFQQRVTLAEPTVRD